MIKNKAPKNALNFKAFFILYAKKFFILYAKKLIFRDLFDL